ncbi:Fis family sigma-54 specific transcriptional regulator [Salinisphaera hydrothermalis C27AD]
MEGKRLLLDVRPESTAPLSSFSDLDAEWEIHTCDGIDGVRALANDRSYPVGVIDLSHRCLAAPGIEELLLATPRTRWIALIKAGALEDGVLRRLIRDLFHDFHTLPVDVGRLRMALGHAHGMGTLDGSDCEYDGDFDMVGQSAPMRELYRAIEKAARAEAPVLIHGESGTGKELVARAIHTHSARRYAPFIAVNCGALPANLIQSELFGHERGSFTGAHRRMIGKIEAAAPGTILLDEIGDLPLDLQVNLLRFLEDHRIERLGANTSVDVNVRVIAASHVNLEQAVADSRFREDLYYRLNVLRLKVPPLREREGDVRRLAQCFFDQFRAEAHPRVRGFTHGALQSMENHSWPGNVRELINRVRHAMVMGEHPLITAADLGLTPNGPPAELTLDQVRDEAERHAVENALRRVPNNLSEAARQLGISRVTLYRLIQKHDLRT